MSAQTVATIAAIAQTLRALSPAEIPIGVAWLAGETRQGKRGVGYALLAEATDVPAAKTASLSVEDVDRALEAIALISGAGSRAPGDR